MKTYTELPVNFRIEAYRYAKDRGYRGKQITEGLRFDIVKVGANICVKGIETIDPSLIVAFAPVQKPRPEMNRPEGVTVFHTETDSGRKNSKRPKQTNDCTVRAMAAAFDLDYDYTYDMLAQAGRKCSRGFFLGAWLMKNASNGMLLDRKVEKLSFPAVKGESRMNVEKFVKEFATGTYIIRVAKHVACVKDGKILDWMTVEGSGDRCVYLAYKITNPQTK